MERGKGMREPVVLRLTPREAVALRRAASDAGECEFSDSREYGAYRRAMDKLWDGSCQWSRFHFDWTPEDDDS